MLDVRCNYKGSYTCTLCPVCEQFEDTQSHLLICDKLADTHTMVDTLPVYSNLFGDNLLEKVSVSRILQSQLAKRKEVLRT